MGLPISLPLALSAESRELTAFEQLLAVVMLLFTALPLLHSILTGWTLSRNGIVTLESDAFSYTLMQLFYSYILGLILLMLLLR